MSKTQTIFKAGNSLAVSIPSRIVKQLGLAIGQKASCHHSITKSKITYQFPDAKQLPLLASREKSQTTTKSA
jgi:antitoxin component of MazEF toxin-antitoxin module